MSENYLKLNLGCGTKKKEGFINCDIDPKCKPDKIINLENLPLPWADSSVELIYTDNCLEHLHPDKQLPLMQEIERILIPHGRIEIIVPLFPSNSAVNDPTHLSFFVPETFLRYSPEWWASLDAGMIGYNVHFKINHMTIVKQLIGNEFEEREVRVVMENMKGEPIPKQPNAVE